MKKSRITQLLTLALISALFLSSFSFAADDKDKKDKKDSKTANSQSKSKTKSRLSDKENPEKIGSRDINNNQINFYSVEKEIAIGQGLAGEVERQLKLIDDPIVSEYINRVGQNIVLHSDAKVPFTIRVVDSDEINAFALPGGFFFVNKGLILAADNEAELVGVMAHEIAHVAARHGTEQVSKGQLFQFGSLPLIFIAGPIGIAARSAANFALPLTFLKFSRNAEAEADLLGAQYTWASGYDPQGMVSMFQKLSEREKTKVATIFSDHPATGDRAVKVNTIIGKFPEKDEYVLSTSEFNKVKSRLALVSGSRRAANSDGSIAPPSDRPTLKKRRDDSGAPGDAGTDPGSEPPKERPTLRRRDGDPGVPSNNSDSNAPSNNDNDRPTLRRAGDKPNDTPPPSDDDGGL
jgi:beta-barrel assembly-enhancing protease